jgi:hypothetical protein
MFSAVKEVLQNAADASMHILGLSHDEIPPTPAEPKESSKKIDPTNAPLSPARVKPAVEDHGVPVAVAVPSPKHGPRSQKTLGDPESPIEPPETPAAPRLIPQEAPSEASVDGDTEDGEFSLKKWKKKSF